MTVRTQRNEGLNVHHRVQKFADNVAGCEMGVEEMKCRRGRLRLPYIAAVELTTVEGRVIRGNLRDIGLESMFAKVEKRSGGDLQPGDDVNVCLQVTQGQSRLTIGTPGKVVRFDEQGCALIFKEKLKWWPLFSLFPMNEQFLFDVVANA